MPCVGFSANGATVDGLKLMSCDVCLTTRGLLMAHSEDYSEPFGSHIGRWGLCYFCHMILHCRARAPEAFASYSAMLEAGQRFVNTDKMAWHLVQRLLRGHGSPEVENMNPIENPFGPLLAEGAAVLARQPAPPVSRDTNVGLDAKRAIAYRRVSSSEQVESGLGLDAQASAIETCCTRLGLVLVQTFTDEGLSGGLPLERRAGLLAAVGALRRNDTLVIAKRDRARARRAQRRYDPAAGRTKRLPGRLGRW